MKFSEFLYQRPDLEKYKIELAKITNIFSANKTLDEEIKALKDYFVLDDEVSTMFELVFVKYSINTNDSFFREEKEFIDEVMPLFRKLDQEFLKTILKSKHLSDLKLAFGNLFFDQIALNIKTFDPKIITLLQQENKLSTEYNDLKSNAQIHFQNKTYNLSQMSLFSQDIDRNIRKEASLAVSKFYLENEEKFDRIYDSLVKTRTKIAKELGYDNFIQLGYDRLNRFDYQEADVFNYRKQILEFVVPYALELTNKKVQRIKITDPQSYDLNLAFLSGNPTPKGDDSWMLKKASKMYKEMSKETELFFNFMNTNQLLDLKSKPGKIPGGYCTFISKYKAPFIFANFNGTSHDVDVLTHEAGHAFQAYLSKDLIPPYRFPTMEAAEIHSMSMEFFSWPWIKEFFLEDSEKYQYLHLSEALLFLPYGALVDEFQHEVYQNYELSIEERKALWRQLEKKYLPYKKYDGDPFLDKGTFWYRQGHIFDTPFYYIDYTLAQVCAFQYWIMDRNDHQSSWNSYLKLSKLGGSLTFVNLLRSVGLDVPFKDGVLKRVIEPIKAYLDSIEDSKL